MDIKHNTRKALRIPSLIKATQSGLIALSTLFAYVIQSPELNAAFWITGLGIFLLTCGSSTLNNYQDRRIDSRFKRTKDRPLSAGRIDPRVALALAIGLMGTGLTVLYLVAGSFKLVIWGFLGVFIYNVIYTPLKTKTLLAIFPGAICGMVPPLIGWVSAGGELFSVELLVIITIFGIWQIPHYWTILLQYAEDYRANELGNMLKWFHPNQVKRLMFIWVFSFSLLTLLLPFVRIVRTNMSSLFLLVNALALIIVFFYQLLLKKAPGNYRLLSVHLNVSLASVMLLSSLERLI